MSTLARMKKLSLKREERKKEERVKKESKQERPEAFDYPSRITSDEYFGAASGGLFRDPNVLATEANLELLLSVLGTEDEQAQRLRTCNYFQFSGPEESLWDPIFNARLAYEGFFTTTLHSLGKTEPLPELKPFYGVLTWPNFRSSKRVRKTINRLSSGCQYRLINNKDPDRTWKLLNAYHMREYGARSNWLTEQYFNMLKLASENTSINFKLCCIELYSENEADSSQVVSDADGVKPLAGEIGFSIGRVYTSLSGWTETRTEDSLGFVQLVLLGKWLECQGYEFWSLGHCTSPEHDYKRELGHRVYPRTDFLALLKQHRGDFRQSCAASVDKVTPEGFRPLEDGGTCQAKSLLN